MNKKILITGFLGLLSVSSLANHQVVLTQEQMQQKQAELLAQDGIFLPKYNEINIIPIDAYINKNSIKNESDKYVAERMKEFLAMNEEQKRNGYVKSDFYRSKELMDLKNIISYKKKNPKSILRAESTGMRFSINELKLAYTFVGVPKNETSFIIGFSPYGAYKSIKNGDAGDGWDGAVQFFEKEGIGSCAFTEHNRRLTKIGVELIKEFVTYEIDNKPTIILIKGQKDTGFHYSIKWYDSTFSRELECANPEFNQKLRDDIIGLAIRIEYHQQSI